VYDSVLQCMIVCCSGLQCVMVGCIVFSEAIVYALDIKVRVAVLHCVAVYFAECDSMLQCLFESQHADSAPTACQCVCLCARVPTCLCVCVCVCF